MEVLKAQLAKVQQQLGQLTASQKMLTASLLAIMVLTLMYWARYAGTPEMEPVLPQSLAADDMMRMKMKLSGAGIPLQISGDQILVPTERRFEAMALLAYDNVLPSDTSNAFEQMMSKMNPFDKQSSEERKWNVGLQKALEGVILRFPNVKSATVIIDPKSERRVGGNIEPSASVAIFTRDGVTVDKKLANTVADLVSGSHSALNRARVMISVNSKSVPIADRRQGGIAGGTDISDMEREVESQLEQKLRDSLSGYGAVNASVRVALDIEATKTRETNITEIKSKESEIRSETTETSSGARMANEPGTASNAPLSVGTAISGAGGGNTSNTTKEETRMQNFPSQKEIVSDKPAGQATPVSAAIQVPFSYFAGMLKTSAGDKEPDHAAVNDYFTKNYQKRIVDHVKAAIGIKDENQVVVDLYMDQLPMAMAVGNSGAASAGMSVSVTGYAKEIAIGVLALVSLGMVSMMVKKSTPAPIVTAEAAVPEVQESVQIASDEDIAGEVAEADQALDGMELDDSAVRTQQMISQVSTMVKENPDAAANLVKRWLNRT